MPCDLYVPDPYDLDDAFARRFPALGLRETVGSGARHGDGDLRPEARLIDTLSFASEGKHRYGAKKGVRPTAAEWKKAIGDPAYAAGTPNARGQLRRLDPQAVRLFVVYNHRELDLGVSVPIRDVRILRNAGIVVPGAPNAFRSSGIPPEPYVHLGWYDWLAVYAQLEHDAAHPDEDVHH